MTDRARKPAPATRQETPQVSSEEARIIAERLATFEKDREAARPADEVLERLLRRHSMP
jgi:hypothetical protein